MVMAVQKMIWFLPWDPQEPVNLHIGCPGCKGIKKQRGNKIIITRPAVEAGESLGFFRRFKG